ncbi:MAG: DUF3175 domain-containing protein [Elusimicrobia bacterium]|nr:DUF3175 domain-containing protein [Elusimicrobiota bacterium]
MRAARWVRRVALTSNALDLPKGIFTRPARGIALGLRRSARASRRRKGTEFQSAMSMLNYHINRGGRRLSAERRRELQKAKGELRRLYGRRPG